MELSCGAGILARPGQSLSEPILILNTADALSLYEPNFKDKVIYDDYLVGLIEAWLSDLKSHWMSNSPAYIKELQTIRFLELIQGGLTHAYR